MKQLKISIIFLAVMSLFLGILYPLMMTLAAQIAFRERRTAVSLSSTDVSWARP